MLDRSLNMLRSPKCLCCIPLETGCFIFGVFNAVLSGLGVLALSLAHYWVMDLTGDDTFKRLAHNPDYIEDDLMFQSKAALRQHAITMLATVTVLFVVFLWFLISFIFSVFLCYGTQKRRPGFVKAYLIYGVVQTVLMILGAILYSWLFADIVGGSLVLLTYGIYSMLLLMVRRMHEVMRAEQARDQALLLPGPGACIKA